MYTEAASSMTRAGCLIASTGIGALAVAMFGLRHALNEAARALPELPGLAANLTIFARALIHQAAANVTVEAAVVLIALGMYLLYQSGSQRA
jgi:hypothetical protein